MMSPTQLLGIVLIAPFAALVIVGHLFRISNNGERMVVYDVVLWIVVTMFLVGLALLLGGGR